MAAPGRVNLAALLLCLTLLLGWAWIGGAGSAHAIQEATWREGTAEWDAVEVAAGGRSVEIAYLNDSCGERNAHTALHETSTTVTIALLRETAEYPPSEGVMSCPGPKEKLLWVALSRPLAGRPIYGQSSMEAREVFGNRGSSEEAVEVPRLIGFAPQDAKRALLVDYLHGRVQRKRRAAGRPRVSAQVPAPGHKLEKGAVVQLTVAG